MAGPGRAAALALTLLAAAGLAPGAAAQVEVTAEPAMTRGTLPAPVVIVEFSDYQCPFCRRASQALAAVLPEFAGRVAVVFKDFPLSIHPRARAAHEAARCAGPHGRYWAYHERLFAGQPHFERADLIRYAVEVGLDGAAFARCLDDRRFAAAVEADVAQGRALGIRQTPTFLINGRMLVGAHPADTFRAVIAEALRSP